MVTCLPATRTHIFKSASFSIDTNFHSAHILSSLKVYYKKRVKYLGSQGIILIVLDPGMTAFKLINLKKTL